jgi:hypothetical protein
MTGNRRARIMALLDAAPAASPLPVRIAAATREVLDAEHVGLLLASSGVPLPLDCGDEVGMLLDEQQVSLGDGPSVIARTSATPEAATDLGSPSGARRWPLFAPVAADRGVGSTVAMPLRAGAARLGVLTAYRSSPAGPDDEQFADALVLSALVTDLLVGEQAGAAAGDLATAVASGLETQSVVHQAAGMLSEQLGISIIEALVRLRAHATAHGLPLTAVGRRIVSGELDLER